MCPKCKGSGRKNLNKTWKLIFILIDYKIKQFILDPIKCFQEQEIENDKKGSMNNMFEKTAILSDNDGYRDINSIKVGI